MGETQKKCKEKGFSFLSLALLTFAGLGLEDFMMCIIEPLIFHCGSSFSKWPVSLHIFHWCATCVLWATAAILLISLAKRKYGFDIFWYKGKMNLMRWLLCFAILAVIVAVSIWDWNGFKVVKEFQYNGWLKFIFQYIYYLVETVLVILIIAFCQRAGEIWFHSEKIPWGGLLAGLTWGLVHILTKESILTGLITFCSGILFGMVYLLTKKNVRTTYPLILLMFVL